MTKSQAVDRIHFIFRTNRNLIRINVSHLITGPIRRSIPSSTEFLLYDRFLSTTYIFTITHT